MDTKSKCKIVYADDAMIHHVMMKAMAQSHSLEFHCPGNVSESAMKLPNGAVGLFVSAARVRLGVAIQPLL